MQLTDGQILTMVLGFAIPIAALIYSNSRVGDIKDLLKAEVGKLKAEIMVELTAIRADITALRADVTTKVEGRIREHEAAKH